MYIFDNKNKQKVILIKDIDLVEIDNSLYDLEFIEVPILSKQELTQDQEVIKGKKQAYTKETMIPVKTLVETNKYIIKILHTKQTDNLINTINTAFDDYKQAIKRERHIKNCFKSRLDTIKKVGVLTRIKWVFTSVKE